MKISKLEFDQIPQLSKRDKAYQNGEETLKPFYKYTPEVASFSEIIATKSKQNIDRNLLFEVLTDQYANITKSALVSKHISLFKEENTYCIITAHQPSLFTGPLYYIFKICSTIKLCHDLKLQYPDFNFVPVFVNGSEDHDFDEIKSLNLFGKSYTWSYNHQGEPVGKITTVGLEETLDEIKSLFREGSVSLDLLNVFKEYINSADTYSTFTLNMVNHLFGKFGLICINMDNQKLKNAFKNIIKKEITNSISHDLINQTQSDIEHAGFKSQAFAREINFFIITEDGLRKRIEKIADRYHIVDTDITYDETTMLSIIDTMPERFSPNVIMRPIYQEFIMPNLAYIGGGGELAYWMERQSQFEAFDIPYPMLIRRNSAMILDKSISKQLEKLNISLEDLLQERDQLVNQFLKSKAGDQFSLVEYKEVLNSVFKNIREKTALINQSLVAKVDAEATKVDKAVQQIEDRLKKEIKNKSEQDINRIDKLYDKLFPKNGLQERHNNFLEYVDRYGLSILDEMVQSFNPLDKSFLVLDFDA